MDCPKWSPQWEAKRGYLARAAESGHSVRFRAVVLVAIDGTLSVDAPGPGIGEGVLHGLHLGRHLAKLLWLLGELFPNSLQPERDERFEIGRAHV